MDANTCYLGTVGLRELALYSHLIPAVAVLVLSVFALVRAPDKRKAGIFFAFTLTFSFWLVADMVNWTINDYYWVAATWAPLDYIEIIFFLILLCFVHDDVFEDLPSRALVGAIGLSVLAPFFITASGHAVGAFNLPTCEMLDNSFLAQYKLILEAAVLALIFWYGAIGIWRARGTRSTQIRIALVSGSIFLFLGTFAGAEYVSTQTEVYEYMLYTLFILPIFVLFLTIAITRYGTFKLGDIATRVLFYVFLVLAATQFFFVDNIADFLLASMSFAVVLTLGVMLFFASERELRQRLKIEAQEKELELANQKQESLLHFISHEIKGYLTEGQNAFAGIVEGDFGKPAPKIEEISRTALTKMRQGVSTIMNILDASNFKKGTVTYNHSTCDMQEAARQEIEKLKPKAAEKGLALNLSVDESKTYTCVGDIEKISEHVIRNLIDNAIRYTPQGSIDVSLADGDGKIRFSVKDTGVGITPEDMQRLFTEGGHGKDSIKINVDSTGYGLFIAKQVVEAHGGTIRAKSEGAGKGSEFVVELPTN